MTGMRRFAQNQCPEQTIAVIRSLGYTLQPAASGVKIQPLSGQYRHYLEA